MPLAVEKLRNLDSKLADFSSLHEEQAGFVRLCERCHGTTNLKACSGCVSAPLKTFYCSRKCQKLNWAYHKQRCAKERETYQDRDPGSKSFRKEKRQLKGIAVSKLVNVDVINWAARQAFGANTQHDPTKTILVIEVFEYQHNDTLIQMFPVGYSFRRFTEDSLFSLANWPGWDRSYGCLGYYMIETMPTSEIMPILPLSLDLDFVDDLVEQWPYIFAQIIAERETQAQNSTLKLVTILETVKKNNGPGQPLKRFACPKFDDKWLMTEGDWLRWKEAFNSVQ